MAERPSLSFGPGGDAGSEFLPDDLPAGDQADILALARLVLEAVLYPNPLPPDPLPAPLELALAIVANRIWRAGEQAQTGGTLPVVSESIGSYSYRLATPERLDVASLVRDDVLTLIAPWAAKRTAFELHVGGAELWPWDWWQRNLDNLLKRGDATVAGVPAA